LQKEQEEDSTSEDDDDLLSHSSSTDRASPPLRRFNPRVDPTVLFCEMRRLKLYLDNFSFRIEKKERTLFDPVLQGRGQVALENVSIRLRVECYQHHGVPILHVSEWSVALEQVQLQVHGFSADWLLNRAVQVFSDSITAVVQDNLRQQMAQHVQKACASVNDYLASNPSLLLNLLGIALEDLEERKGDE